ncbi:unnamed protein product [Prorocentrum cordatum]|uniref:Uncharacterized protein n=1 Tax=Prorocentrum cordatum TaxID=2364126 RepID=A0ABN9WUG4_9DINO|nr:unnamed protein product [Polarella glacialis]
MCDGRSDTQCQQVCDATAGCSMISNGGCCFLFKGDACNADVSHLNYQSYLEEQSVEPATTTTTTEAPTAPTAAGSAGGPLSVSASGDPHLVNVHGQRFDLYQPGVHSLLRIPKSGGRRAAPAVQARAAHIGAGCAELYFTEISITGTWARRHRTADLHWAAQDVERGRARWSKFHQIGVKVVHGHTLLGHEVSQRPRTGPEQGQVRHRGAPRRGRPHRGCHSQRWLQAYPDPLKLASVVCGWWARPILVADASAMLLLPPRPCPPPPLPFRLLPLILVLFPSFRGCSCSF